VICVFEEVFMVARRRITRLGELLRAVRHALSFDQAALAARVYSSSRNVSRWENGTAVPTGRQAQFLVGAVADAPESLVEELAQLLKVPSPYADDDEDEPTAVVPTAAGAPVAMTGEHALASPAPVTPRATLDELRAIVDGLVFSTSEERDVLPRHLRAFGVELLLAVDRAGVAAREAAAVVAGRSAKPHPLAATPSNASETDPAPR
jgi:transcriptional regulator with XRE-family HTH domain